MNDVVTGTTLVVVPPLPTLLGLCVVSRLLVLSEILKCALSTRRQFIALRQSSGVGRLTSVFRFGVCIYGV